jgi:hypothetical protein
MAELAVEGVEIGERILPSAIEGTESIGETVAEKTGLVAEESTAAASKGILLGLSTQELIAIGTLAGSLLLILPGLQPAFDKLGLSQSDVNNISNNLQQVSQSISPDGKVTSKLQPEQIELYKNTLTTLKRINDNPNLKQNITDAAKRKLEEQLTGDKLQKNLNALANLQKTGSQEGNTKRLLMLSFLGTDKMRIIYVQVILFALLALLIWWSGLLNYPLCLILISYLLTGSIVFVLLNTNIL